MMSSTQLFILFAMILGAVALLAITAFVLGFLLLKITNTLESIDQKLDHVVKSQQGKQP